MSFELVQLAKIKDLKLMSEAKKNWTYARVPEQIFSICAKNIKTKTKTKTK